VGGKKKCELRSDKRCWLLALAETAKGTDRPVSLESGRKRSLAAAASRSGRPNLIYFKFQADSDTGLEIATEALKMINIK